MKKILITGTSGFIGKNLVEQLNTDYVIYSPSSEELDLLNTEAIRVFLKKNQFDIIIHSANRNSTRRSITQYDSLDGNLRMFFNLQQCSDLYEKMIYFGSGAEYDNRNYVPKMKEDRLGQFIPADSYGFSKYVMAKSCEKSENIYELCLFGVYGKYEEWERRFISNAICRALKGMDITLQKNVKFDYLWIDDLVEIVKWFVENNPKEKRYNVCRGEGIELYSLAVLVREILSVNNSIIVQEKGWKPEYSGDNNRLLKEIKNFQFTSFEKSISALHEYYKDIIDTIDESKLI